MSPLQPDYTEFDGDGTELDEPTRWPPGWWLLPSAPIGLAIFILIGLWVFP